MWMSEWRKFKVNNCEPNGSQEKHQLTMEERLGKASLMKRIAGGEIHVSQSDKGKGLVVMTNDLYHQMSKDQGKRNAS